MREARPSSTPKAQPPLHISAGAVRGAVSRLCTVTLLQALAYGCSAPCLDRDGDGYGEHCERGADCDDRDGARALVCDVAIDCVLRPQEPACRCAVDSRRSCYSGELETQQEGICKAGVQRCIDGIFGPCEGQVLPRFERCDDLDDDCDGRVDEGVHSPCGGCTPDCVGEVWGDLDSPFVVEPPLLVLPGGELTLQPIPVSPAHVWVPNSDGWTLSHIDANSRRETARHRLPGRPQRIAVDYAAAAYVLSTAGQEWILSKLVSEDACDGPELPGRDPCLRWSEAVAPGPAGLAALAVDGTRDMEGELNGHVWAATAGQVRQLDGRSGAAMTTIEIPSLQPSDATFDLQGRLWIADRDGILWELAGFEPGPPTVTAHPLPYPCFTLEAIVARSDDSLLLSTFACETVVRFDPESDRFAASPEKGLLSTRGLLATPDGDYVVHTAAAVSAVTHHPLRLSTTFPLLGPLGLPRQTQAIAATGDGALWVPSHGGAADGRGLLTRLDPLTGQVTDQLVVGWGPAALGDLTGQRLLASFPPRATLRHRFAGCADGSTLFQAIHIDFSAGPGGTIAVAYRLEGDAEPVRQPFIELATLSAPRPLPLPDASGSAITLELTLNSINFSGAPRIRRVGLQWTCAGPQ